MLELAILGLLKERSMHGYELKKQLGQNLGFFWTVSFGSLYPTLKKLERRGVVEKIFPPEETSRRKQVYRITEAGETEFFTLLEEGPSSREEEKFPLRLAFFRYLRPETRIRLLERRRVTLEDRLREGHQTLRRAKRGRVDTYTLSLMRHGVDVTQHDIDWLNELIAAERAALGESTSPHSPAEAEHEAAPERSTVPMPAADTEPDDDEASPHGQTVAQN